ncbi:MAG: chaperone modulator CbpM [Pseudotabrizicola sp.]|jgi:chaperone modulatory protein CbpM|uniref:chaperone modulator CbpM n=1 Tax=Pseudotabrizicola sp. TaxID=2939647 RepID=UPI00271F077C|nr:chaperone modulator CbpM [Pseudotabrizicola sp.]MDO9640592.1 chaperone modulator CbpM [Pseudotabrizicola sp.]
MPRIEIVTGIVLDEVDLDELAQACSVDALWIVERVEAGLLGEVAQPQRFSSAELLRAQRLLAIERDFDANPELAALVVDLIEEVGRLKGRLRAAGIDDK